MTVVDRTEHSNKLVVEIGHLPAVYTLENEKSLGVRKTGSGIGSPRADDSSPISFEILSIPSEARCKMR